MTPEQVERILESNSKAIAANSDTVAEVRRQSQRQIDALYQLNAELVRDRATMFEIIRGLNDDRIRTSENLSSLAENVARIADALEQREE